MKTIIFIAIIAFATSDLKQYKLEKLGMIGLVNNTEKLKVFVDCLLDRAPCSDLYNTYKVLCTEAVEQKCKKCSPFQKHNFWLFLQGVTAKFPEDYFNFRHKYDPQNKYFEALESEIRKYSNVY